MVERIVKISRLPWGIEVAQEGIPAIICSEGEALQLGMMLMDMSQNPDLKQLQMTLNVELVERLKEWQEINSEKLTGTG